MAITLGKKKTDPSKEKPWEGEEAPEVTKAKAAAAEEKSEKQSAPPKTGTSGLLQRGAVAKETMEREEARAEARSKNQNLRFWIEDGKDASITFLDGELDADGMLDIPYYFEHNVKIAGKFGNHFACIQENEPCPVCEGGDSPSYVGLLSIIDHRKYKASNGKEYANQVRLFVAKRQTIKQLQKLAEKRGGLTGCTFDVSRTGAQSAAVGSMFDFTEKVSLASLQKAYGSAEVKIEPLNYEDIVESITFTADELRKQGFGSLRPPVGSEQDDDDGHHGKGDSYKGQL